MKGQWKRAFLITAAAFLGVALLSAAATSKEPDPLPKSPIFSIVAVHQCGSTLGYIVVTPEGAPVWLPANTIDDKLKAAIIAAMPPADRRGLLKVPCKTGTNI